eukprot:3041148-Prymnesium_polylepis.1
MLLVLSGCARDGWDGAAAAAAVGRRASSDAFALVGAESGEASSCRPRIHRLLGAAFAAARSRGRAKQAVIIARHGAFGARAATHVAPARRRPCEPARSGSGRRSHISVTVSLCASMSMHVASMYMRIYIKQPSSYKCAQLPFRSKFIPRLLRLRRRSSASQMGGSCYSMEMGHDVT